MVDEGLIAMSDVEVIKYTHQEGCGRERDEGTGAGKGGRPFGSPDEDWFRVESGLVPARDKSFGHPIRPVCAVGTGVFYFAKNRSPLPSLTH
jgi:hypothetical protein